MNLDQHTFGKSPAAIYLAFHLNKLNSSCELRKVSATLSRYRATFRGLVRSQVAGTLSAASFASLLELIKLDIGTEKREFEDALTSNLVNNILIGELRAWSRQAAKNKSNSKDAQRAGKSARLPIEELTKTEEEQRIALLKDRSRAYLARRNKPNTLYPAD